MKKMELAKFSEFLKKSRVTDGKPYNIVSMRLGKYYVSNKNHKEFLNLYTEAVPYFSQDVFYSLVWKPPKHRQHTPLFLDFDIELKEDVHIPNSKFIKLGRQLSDICFGQTNINNFEVTLTRKSNNYKKKDRKTGEDFWKTGFHLYIFGCLVDLEIASKIREIFLNTLHCLEDEYPIRNTPETIFDKKVYPYGRNGIIFCGDRKPQEYNRQSYHIFFRGVYDGIICDWKSFESFKPEDTPKLLSELKDNFFGFLWNEPDWPKTKCAEKDEIKMEEKMDLQPDVENIKGIFSLEKFLEATAGWVPKEKEYLQICMFLRKIKYDDPEKANTLCNKAWNYSDDETSQLIDKYSDITVNKGSIVRILKLHATKPYDLADIFCRKKYEYHNEASMFDNRRKVWTHMEIVEFFSDVYSHTWGDNTTRFVYKEQFKKRFGKDYYTVTKTVISDNMPFASEKSDKLIFVVPSFKKVLKELRKLCKEKNASKQAHDLLSSFKTLPKSEQYAAIYSFLGDRVPEPEEKGLGELFSLAKKRAEIPKSYHSFTIIPYLEHDPTPIDCLNIFSGFEMQKFRNTDIDVKKTAFWQWLWIAWSNRSEYKMKFLLNYFATKLQKPHRKIKKFIISFSRLTSTGKTSVLAYLTAIFGQDKVLFSSSLDDFFNAQNFEHLGKLFIIIDDIEKANQKQSDRLKSLITSNSIKVKKLYQDPITVPSYCDLIATSNEREPTFVSETNRRSELVAINPELKGDSEEKVAFWDKFYEDTEDAKICGAWFEFLATYPIDMNVSSETCRFSLHELNVQKMKSMKIVHKFLVDFFSDEQCFERIAMSRSYVVPATFWNDISFRNIEGQRAVILTKNRAFEYFRDWVKRFGKRITPIKTTFFDYLAEVGINAVRKVMDNGRKLNVLVFRQPYVKKSLMAYYGVESKDIKMHWIFNSEEEFKILQKKSWRFREVLSTGFIQ